MSIDGLIAAREASYRGVGSWRTPAVYNTVDQLLDLREAGYLIGPDARTIAGQKYGPHPHNPDYSEAPPGQATARHWTYDEMKSLTSAYWRDEHVTRIRQAFPVEAAKMDRDKWNHASFIDLAEFGENQ